MTVHYLAKANGTLRAVAELPELPDFTAITAGTDVVVPVGIFDGQGGVEVVHADITTWVTPR